ncbi:MAG: hypothetical protein KC503_12030 [Myxococcales bacterium]|nr:hypothetical protein [Myxococcales bacterium]
MFSLLSIPYETPEPLRARYAHLESLPVEPTADGGATFGPARLWRRRGVNVLSLAGDRYEMAFQHGRLLRDEIASGTLEAVGALARRGIVNSVGEGRLARMLRWYCETALADPMLRHALRRARQVGDESPLDGYGLAAGAGIPARTVFRAPLGPEVAQLLLGKTAGRIGGADPNMCTSFVAWGARTANGELIIGRNTDYPLTGYFDKHPTVIYFAPNDGAMRYMTVTSAGVHNAATGGLNEAGLYLAIHTVPTTNVSERGLPVLMVGQQILRMARTLREAEYWIKQATPAAGWNFHVVSTRERRAATFELCAENAHVVYSEGESHVTTNHYRSERMLPHQLHVNRTIETDTNARMARCAQLIDEAAGKLDARRAAAILGDKHDPESGRVRFGPNCVSASTTVSSSVWLPESGRVYVANGRAPVSQNEYVEVPTLDRLCVETFADAPYEVIDNDVVRRDHAAMLGAEQAYQRARERFEYENDAAAACALMRRCFAEHADDAHDPALRLHHALYAIRCDRRDEARAALDAILADPWDAQRARVARYLRARLAADAGQREAALADLALLEADAQLDGALRKAVDKCARRLRWPLVRRVRLRPNDIAPMSWMADAFRYTAII